MRADLEDVGQDKFFGRGFAQGLCCVPCLRREQRLMVFSANLSNDGIAELRKQVCKAEADAARLPQVVPR